METMTKQDLRYPEFDQKVFDSLVGRSYIKLIFNDTWALTLQGVTEAAKLMKPWKHPFKVEEVTVDEFLKALYTGKATLLKAMVEIEKIGLSPDFVRVDDEHYAMRFKAVRKP